ncbi:condensin-2 complex subunit H2 [Impatiens glandulifera]|uniref:condensin-2 complex subunit H2 n=1 Tax=Impatiens glandulifera TaxID=253017 RepID=UPI001FB188E4|nr:condensin-2 complex subunit H2 [Impatiens glandulifera]XP_047334215.1 condensin-2 complex subunit H2 [Impatiens glandulifera]
MSHDREEPGSSRIHAVQPLRDLESNWTVDLAKNLEEYLLKICSGEITGEDSSSPLSVNFAEAALLLQGSIQVYSRKVEYLYSLVLHALEFISHNRQQVQPEGTSAQENENTPQAVTDEENENFLDLDDIPVDPKNSLDIDIGREDALNHFVKPPANLVVLEGDCLEATGDCGELETYLLSTSNLYRDFIILEPCNATAVDDYLKDDSKAGRDRNGSCRRTSFSAAKSRKILNSPLNQSGGTARRQSVGKNKNVNPEQTPIVEKINPNDSCIRNDSFAFEENIHEFEVGDGNAEPEEPDVSDDEHDPWKPLNPHEPGNLKVKSFKKVKAFRRQRTTKLHHLQTDFPPAKLNGTISPEFNELFEMRSRASDRQDVTQIPPYEKLRQALVDGVKDNDLFQNQNDQKDQNDDVDDNNDLEDFSFDVPDFEIPEHTFDCGGDVPIQTEKHDDGVTTQESQEGPSSQASLEDLCRSHLDALLASIAETEERTELATRVSTWKQRIEQNLEEQESRPEFDIHEYGERVLDKLSSQAGEKPVLSYGDIVRGQEKHEVARTFSALLQLVNNRNVDLEKNAGSVCYEAANPFHVRLISHVKKQVVLPSSKKKKRINSPIQKRASKDDNSKLSAKGKNPAVSSTPSEANCNFAVNLEKPNGIRCTPDSKRRRKSRHVQPMDMT